MDSKGKLGAALPAKDRIQKFARVDPHPEIPFCKDPVPPKDGLLPLWIVCGVLWVTFVGTQVWRIWG